MSPPDLRPGDRVVELGALTVSAAAATGAVAGAWLVWLIKRSWLASAGAFIMGAVIGFVLAQVIVRVMYRRSDGRVTVVKVGPASLRSTIPAGLVGGLGAAFLVPILVLLAFSPKTDPVALIVVALGCGVVLGVLFACVASLA